MKVSRQLKVDINEVSFGYNTYLGGYTTLMSNIAELGKIPNVYITSTRLGVE